MSSTTPHGVMDHGPYGGDGVVQRETVQPVVGTDKDSCVLWGEVGANSTQWPHLFPWRSGKDVKTEARSFFFLRVH